MRLDRPWSAVDPALSGVLRAGLEDVIDDVIRAVGREVPQYAAAADQQVQIVLRRGVRVALERLMDLLGSSAAALGPALPVYEGIGAAEFAAGRPLQAVLAAYRTGALATWRGLSALAVAAGADAEQTARLAEACFAYIDEISSASAASYARAQSAAAGRREALRRQLLQALLDGPGSAVPALAAELGWREPALLRAAVWDGAELPEGVLGAVADGVATALVAEPEVRRLAPFAPSLGTAGPVRHAPESMRQARLLHRMRATAGGPDGHPSGPVRADDHLAELLLAAEPGLAGAIVADRLAPLAGLDEQRREVAVDTLTAWLALGGSRAAVAAELHVHPQTVAYRMEPLKAQFGAALGSSRGRWELLLAGRAEQVRRRLRAAGPPASAGPAPGG
jgi:hypothetical protein